MSRTIKRNGSASRKALEARARARAEVEAVQGEGAHRAVPYSYRMRRRHNGTWDAQGVAGGQDVEVVIEKRGEARVARAVAERRMIAGLCHVADQHADRDEYRAALGFIAAIALVGIVAGGIAVAWAMGGAS